MKKYKINGVKTSYFIECEDINITEDLCLEFTINRKIVCMYRPLDWISWCEVDDHGIPLLTQELQGECF